MIASARLAYVPELLEPIFSYLDVLDLGVAGRACHQFSAMLLCTPSLQERLFLVPHTCHPKRQTAP